MPDIDAYTGILFRSPKEGETEAEYAEAQEEHFRSYSSVGQWLTTLRRYDVLTQMKILGDLVSRGQMTPAQAAGMTQSLGINQGTIIRATSDKRTQELQEEQDARKRQLQANYQPQATEVAPLSPASKEYYAFIEGLPTPAMQEHYKYQFPAIYAQFGGDQAMAAAEAERIEAVSLADRLKDTLKKRTGDVKREKASLGVAYGARANIYGPLGQATAAQAASEERVKRAVAARNKTLSKPHPFKSHLQQYPFIEDYGKLSPRTRGEDVSRYAPRARYLVGF